MSVYLGIELGSTRIKAVAIDKTGKQLASGDFNWENQLNEGIWTYPLDDAWQGLRESISNLASDYKNRNNGLLPDVTAIGISAMMHGYLVFDKNGNQLTPFRTWRNTMTESSATFLTDAFGFNIPQRWSIAHLHHAMTSREAHVSEISTLTTLGGYIHYKLTGKNVAGIGEASGIFPIDSSKKDYDERMISAFDSLAQGYNMPWKLRDILPEVLLAGSDAGRLTQDGAKLLDPAGEIIRPGIMLCPPEGDAGTGMVATNAVTPGTGNVSAGTSVFAMLVLDKAPGKPHTQIDMITTPTGRPVAMVHGNNCTADLDAWAGLFQEVLKLMGAQCGMPQIYSSLYKAALQGEDDCGGIVSVNYLSGEHITGFDEGRPLLLRNPDSRFGIENFMRSLLFSSMATLKLGMDILIKDEGVSLSRLLGHGGLFKTPGVAQKLMAGALEIPIAVMDSAGEGGAWGIALLAAYRALKENGETLEEFLEKRIFADTAVSTIEPEKTDTEGFSRYMERYRKALDVERIAVERL